MSPGTVRAADFVVQVLARSGVRHVFGVGGANIEDVYDAIYRSAGAIQAVVAKHEFSAATMADGYARAGKALGVVAATSGGGATNLISGLAEAHASRIPVLALVGQPPTTQEGRGAFQDSSGKAGSLDARQLFGAVSRFCARVADPARLVDLLPRAIAAAQAEPQGPAVLLLPKDVQQALIDVTAPIAESTRKNVSSGPPHLPHRIEPVDPITRDRAAALLGATSGEVLIVAGEGVARAGARAEAAALAESLGAWVAVTPDAKDVFDNADPRFAGVAGVMGHRNVADCLRRAEVCVLLGTRLPMLARGGLDETLAGTPVVCFDSEAPFVDAITVRGGLRAALRAVTDRLGRRGRDCPPHAGPLPFPADPGGDGMSYRDAVGAIASALPEDANVFVDAGNAGATAIHLLPAPRAGRFVVAVGMGGMGYTFGAGIGAAFATGRRSYVLAGDGAFFMHGLEVHTAVEYDLPVTFVIFNNQAHAMCATREQLFYGDTYSYNLFRPSDIASGVAAMFPTLDATRAESADQLYAALVTANAGAGPAFLTADFDPREMPPFLPFLAERGPLPADRTDRTDRTTDKEPDRAHRPVHIGAHRQAG